MDLGLYPGYFKRCSVNAPGALRVSYPGIMILFQGVLFTVNRAGCAFALHQTTGLCEGDVARKARGMRKTQKPAKVKY